MLVGVFWGCYGAKFYGAFSVEKKYFFRFCLTKAEFMVLTFSDLDFEERKIKVDHQLTRTRNGKYYVEKTKTENGVRFIYMTDEVKEVLLNIIASRQKPRKEMVVDGYKGFLLLDKDGKPKVAMHLEHVMKRLLDKYNATH